MRFMMIIKANEDSEAGRMGSAEQFADMGRYNEQLINAGVLLGAEGLQASSSGARVKQEAGKLIVKDGPFTETKELVAGFWLIDVKSRDEALEWVKRIPFEDGMEVELRKVHEFSDFPPELITEEHAAKEAAWRKANEKPINT